MPPASTTRQVRMYPQELQPQLQAAGGVPAGGFVRIPVSGPGVGTRETGGQLVLPGEAAWNAIKWRLPLGPAYAERPNIGTWGTDPGTRLLGMIPGIGRPLAAAAYAAENPVQWNPSLTPEQRTWETIKNLLGYAGFAGGPIGRGLLGAGRVIDIGEGIAGMFQGHPDRTGMVRGPTLPEPRGQGAPFPPAPLMPAAPVPSFAGRFNQYTQPGENPFINPATGVAPAWAGGPSTWNQPRPTWPIPSVEESLQVQPTVNPWAIPSSTPDYSW